MLKKGLLAAAVILTVLVLGFVGIVAMQPSTFHIERSATMAAPPAKVFEHINNFQNWEAWSPWAKLDPSAKNSFEGPESGKDAIFRWAGNDQVGEGDMTILESKPHELIHIRLHFVKPFEDTATTDFTFQPAGEGTLVTWSMDGQNNFVSKIFCLFMDMEEMIGGKYEEGLANIKKIVEAPPAEGNAPATEAPASSEPVTPGP